MKCIHKKHRSVKKQFLKLTIIGIIFATFFWFSFFSKRLSFKISELAIIEADKRIYNMLYIIINDCIKKTDKEKFVLFKKNKNDEFILTEYNMDELYNLMDLINQKIKEQDNQFIFFIPGGMVSKNFLLNYWGSKIPLKSFLINNIYSNVKTKVTNYGLNNALVEIYIVIDVKQQLIIPFDKKVLNKNYEILVSSYFINGKVPGIYGENFEISSKIFDISRKI